MNLLEKQLLSDIRTMHIDGVIAYEIHQSQTHKHLCELRIQRKLRAERMIELYKGLNHGH